MPPQFGVVGLTVSSNGVITIIRLGTAVVEYAYCTIILEIILHCPCILNRIEWEYE